jgi:hypothetical protein
MLLRELDVSKDKQRLKMDRCMLKYKQRRNRRMEYRKVHGFFGIEECFVDYFAG